MIDNYSLKARIFPTAIVLSPLLILGVGYSLQFEKLGYTLSSLGVTAVLSYLLSQLGRDAGKRKEKDLWHSWGGPPSSQLLRYSDETFDPHTKARYHKRLMELCPVTQPPTAEMEQNDPALAGSIYEAWVRYLITHTRDTKKFSLLLKENTSYGFRRNLWGMKPIGVLIALCSIAGLYVFFFKETGAFDPRLFPVGYWALTFAVLVPLFLWITHVTREWIKIPAFAYGMRLCEAIDQL